MNSVRARSFSAAVICGALGEEVLATDGVYFSAARTAGIPAETTIASAAGATASACRSHRARGGGDESGVLLIIA
jgi:hypothetical protein